MATAPDVWPVRETTTGMTRGGARGHLCHKCAVVYTSEVTGFWHDEIINILNV